MATEMIQELTSMSRWLLQVENWRMTFYPQHPVTSCSTGKELWKTQRLRHEWALSAKSRRFTKNHRAKRWAVISIFSKKRSQTKEWTRCQLCPSPTASSRHRPECLQAISFRNTLTLLLQWKASSKKTRRSQEPPTPPQWAGLNRKFKYQKR